MASLMTSEAFASTPFDYLIAGGGTAGLVLANRLTEIPTVSVGVIEAGEDLTDDKNVTTPLYMFRVQGNPKYDWNFTSEPQVMSVVSLCVSFELNGVAGSIERPSGRPSSW